MTVCFEIPSDVQRHLEESIGDLGQAAKEAFVIRGYEERRFGVSAVRRMLGLETRWDAEQWLAERKIPLNYSSEDLAQDVKHLRELFPKGD